MSQAKWLGRSAIVRECLAIALAAITGMWAATAGATITQGDFSIFGNLSSRWSGRWGEGGAKGNTISVAGTPTFAARESGGSFDFAHWDLVQARQVADLRPDYHAVKNYNLLGRWDTYVIKDADLFAIYRPWYDAFADLKHRGRAEPFRDWRNFNNVAREQEFVRDDLREYYAQLTFTDNFSARIGKQQVIWSEADALSGSDITNPNDLRFHFVHFESPEDLRRNIRMLKFNYILPDFLKTANNELDFFVIPGDWQGTAAFVNVTDARAPYIGPVALNPGIADYVNAHNQPVRNSNFSDFDFAPNLPLGGGLYVNKNVQTIENRPKNTLDNSEFGVRYSTLLPVGNGLQTSLIYLYEARSEKVGIDINRREFSYKGAPPVPAALLPGIIHVPGVFIIPGQFDFGAPPPGHFGATIGTARIFLRGEEPRSHFFGVTGTYYDKDLTDIVYRYDFSYQNKVAIYTDRGNKAGATPGTAGSKWTQFTRWIIAADRPTYIPWLSKQHTFITAQYVMTWYPDRPGDATPNVANTQGKVRELSNFAFLSAVNWLMNGQWVSTNVVAWDWDDNVGNVQSINTYRYSRNILFGLNTIWYQGRTSRWTDPFLFSRSQRINELEFRFTYEI